MGLLYICDTMKNTIPPIESQPRIAIVGGGVAGTSIALRFSELGINTTVIEKGGSLVDGPPFCHLHAGGNLYREISDDDCLTLLEQSLDTVKAFPLSINERPTLFAVPQTDLSDPLDLIPRLEKLRARYSSLVDQDGSNKVLGEPKDYFRLFGRQKLEELSKKERPSKAGSTEDWLVAFTQEVDLDKLKYPVVLVQEYGWSAFRMSAIASKAMKRLPSCHLKLNSKVDKLVRCKDSHRWNVSYTNTETHQVESTEFDYVINACGFKSGEIDDMAKASRKRMVEFKAAYVSHWPECNGLWPEVVFHGKRGTPEGMAQLTPYPDGYFQLHGMTKDITLFDKGLVASSEASAQPALESRFITKIEREWPKALVEQRTSGAVNHLAKYIPGFSKANVAARPLFGAQQIPGGDASLRASDVSFDGANYARTEIVKASSALTAADLILKQMKDQGLVDSELVRLYIEKHYFPVTLDCTDEEVTLEAMMIAKGRGYPDSLAKNF